MFKTLYIVPIFLISAVFSHPAIAAMSPVAVGKVAKQVTVLIKTDQVGSGVIVRREKNTYYVLTAKHVVEDAKENYTIVTEDEKEYRLSYKNVEKFPDVDLAIATFTSDQNYSVAKIGNSNNALEGTAVYVAGFPKIGNAINRSIYQFTPGQVTANASKPLAFGYGLVYTNKTLPGMSGGAVLDNNAQLVAIHGRAEGGSLERQTDTIYVKTGFNLGIPINTFIKKSPKMAAVSSSFTSTSTIPIKVRESGADNFFLQAGDKYQKGDVNGAIRDLNQALKLNPSYAAAYSKRGILKYVLSEQEAALSDFNKALRLNSSDADTYVGRGLTLSALGSKREAIADYTQAIDYNAFQGSAYYNRGVLLYNMGSTPEAVKDLRKAAELFNIQGDMDEYKRAMETIAIALKTCRQAIKTQCDW